MQFEPLLLRSKLKVGHSFILPIQILEGPEVEILAGDNALPGAFLGQPELAIIDALVHLENWELDGCCLDPMVSLPRQHIRNRLERGMVWKVLGVVFVESSDLVVLILQS